MVTFEGLHQFCMKALHELLIDEEDAWCATAGMDRHVQLIARHEVLIGLHC